MTYEAWVSVDLGGLGSKPCWDAGQEARALRTDHEASFSSPTERRRLFLPRFWKNNEDFRSSSEHLSLRNSSFFLNLIYYFFCGEKFIINSNTKICLTIWRYDLLLYIPPLAIRILSLLTHDLPIPQFSFFFLLATYQY